MKQEILWTVLPKGVSQDGSTLHLSVLASPRLDTGGSDKLLADFSDFVDWPDHALKFHIQFNNDPPVKVKVDKADNKLWQALFPPTETLVRAFETADLSKRKIHSFPVENLMGFLKGLYSSVAVNSPDTLPHILDLAARGASSIRTVDGKGDKFSNMDTQLENQLVEMFYDNGHALTAIPPGPPQPQMDYFRAKYFHRFRGRNFSDPVEKPELDFHQALTLLGSHPFLMKKLGLLFDVDVPFAGQAANGTVQMANAEVDFNYDMKSVKTRYELDVSKHRFITAAGPNAETKHGMLHLKDNYSLQQVDVDGAALKAIDYANQLYMRLADRLHTLDSPTEDGLPALRTAGISVVRSGRAGRLSTHFQSITKNSDDLNANNQPDLWAEDVTRGYRVDIEDSSGKWRSLCQRNAKYVVGRYDGTPTTFKSDNEEGLATASVSQDTDPTNTDLFLHEALFHWDGWSLVAPRPGGVIQQDVTDHHEDLDSEGYASNPSETSLDIQISAKPVKNSLPRLRFGQTYRLRARAVDVAGYSEPLSSTDDSEASEPLTYRRFEPIEPPAVAIVSEKAIEGLIGESATRVAIRSYNETPAEDSDVSVEIAERLLSPPRTAVGVIEQYGHLDTPSGLNGSAVMWQRLADMDDFDNGATVPDVLKPADVPAEVPYLWDPFVDAAVLRDVPGAGGALTEVSFDSGPDWWQAKPFRIAAIEGNNPPSWDATQRVLTVELPKATIAKVRFSSKFKATELDKLAIWKWMEEEAFDAEQVSKLQQLAENGQHWMLTPYRELTLVHAVQQPLANPHIDTLSPDKLKIGDTFATVSGDVSLHAASSGKLDLLASWSEPTGYGFERREANDHVFDLPVPTQQDDLMPWGNRRHEFGDTKYRKVSYYTRATTRFRDYFPQTLTADELSRPALSELPPFSDAHVHVCDVLNSARPLAPNILYIIPTFGWEDDDDERGHFSRRQGGVRVYMEQPWFSSGDGELLGVVIKPVGGDNCSAEHPDPKENNLPVQVSEKYKSLVTQWGRDPIWLSGPTHQVPAAEKFTRNVAVQYDLSLAEKANAAVAVAGHAVGFDEERQLFYCDIDIDAGDSYYPFVRLALARYQPKSIHQAELSRVVMTDYAQFAPDRIARVARDIKDASKLQVMVSGTGYRKNASFNCTSTLEARLERYLGPSAGDIGWVPVSLDPVTLENVQALKTLSAWEGVLELPQHSADTRFRVVIEEYENFVSDVPQADLPDEGGAFGLGRQRRLVYSDAVEIEL